MRSGGRGVHTSSTALNYPVPLYFLHFLLFSFSNYASSGCLWLCLGGISTSLGLACLSGLLPGGGGGGSVCDIQTCLVQKMETRLYPFLSSLPFWALRTVM